MGIQLKPVSTHQFNKFFRSGPSGAQLARNPRGQFLQIAWRLQRDIDSQLGQRGFVTAPTQGQGGFQFKQAAFDFHNAQLALKRDFVTSEVERQFGPQGVTSQTTTVNASGQRVPVPGQASSTAPTSAQIRKIEQGFMSPLQRLITGQPPSSTPSPATRRRDPTIVGGAGIQRRRAGGAPARTILTSDADEPIGGQTLLG